MKIVTVTPAGSEKSLFELLQDRKIYIPADCAGNGTCGKCKIRIISGAPKPTEDERRIISEDRLRRGWRLACRCFPDSPCKIEFQEAKEVELEIEESISFNLPKKKADFNHAGNHPINSYANHDHECKNAMCIDIGTTTIAAVLVNADTGDVLGRASSVNRQRIYGTDIISRIQAANNGNQEELTRIVREDIDALKKELCRRDVPGKTVISGNTAMEHMYLGYSCETLGQFPYMPVNIELQKYGNTYILPGISAYVGADVISGICACGMMNSDKITALIDLGTNGEMAIGNRRKILAASTAAGPAFEGGNISCGSAAIPGAIASVNLQGTSLQIKTIGDLAPIGICGTGVVEVVYELCKTGIIDETGLMDQLYFDSGYPLSKGITFTQKDVRQVQMAKSAIHAGLEILTKEYGIEMSQIEKLYLAGGFGQKIDVSKACGIGLIPPELKSRAVAAGNSSLAGAVLFACNEGGSDLMRRAVEITSEINLAGREDFSDLYIKYMDFRR